MSAKLTAADLRIGGFIPFSTVDFPGVLSAVVVCQGCALRCAYCHNPALLDPVGRASVAWARIEETLDARRGLIDAIVFSGGEPLLQRALPAAIKTVKAMGFKVALHTSGAAPARLKAVLADLDWIGFDLKARFSRYAALTDEICAGEKAQRALDILSAYEVPFEVRTTVWPGFHGPTDVAEMAQCAKRAKASAFVLQQARNPVSRRPIASPWFTDAAKIAALKREFPFLILRPA